MNEDHWFREWESTVFGSGYGTGEMPILAVLEGFMWLTKDRSYDHLQLEHTLGKSVTWLLINSLSKANMIEWGTSSRYGWLTPSGEYLKKYMATKNLDQLYEILMDRDEFPCMCDGEIKDHPECGKNPFLHEKIAWDLLHKV